MESLTLPLDSGPIVQGYNNGNLLQVSGLKCDPWLNPGINVGQGQGVSADIPPFDTVGSFNLSDIGPIAGSGAFVPDTESTVGSADPALFYSPECFASSVPVRASDAGIVAGSVEEERAPSKLKCFSNFKTSRVIKGAGKAGKNSIKRNSSKQALLKGYQSVMNLGEMGTYKAANEHGKKRLENQWSARLCRAKKKLHTQKLEARIEEYEKRSLEQSEEIKALKAEIQQLEEQLQPAGLD